MATKLTITFILCSFSLLLSAKEMIHERRSVNRDSCTPTDLLPKPANLSFSVRNDSLKIIRVGEMSGIDTSKVRFAIIRQPLHFNISENINGLFLYIPTNYFGQDRFVYRVCLKSCPSRCDTGVVSLNLYGVCNPKETLPKPANLSFSFQNDSTEILKVGELSGIDTSTVKFSIIGQPTHFSIIDNGNGLFQYQPRSYVGKDNFRYRACLKDCPTHCDTGTVSLDLYGICIVPTIITPNNDGLNDRLLIPCLEGDNFTGSELHIFNQWGDQVFFASPYHNDWEGTYNGQPLPDGTYYYLFREHKATDFQRGYISIFR